MRVESEKPKRIDTQAQSEKLDLNSINIILPALPGGGKSTVGKALAEILGMKFVDTDIETRKTKQKETRLPATVDDIISEDGMNDGDKPGKKAFRVREKEELEKFSSLRGYVIAPGGGIVEIDKNLVTLREPHNIVVYLRTDVDVCARRAVEKPNEDRPLFEIQNPSDSEKLDGEEELGKKLSKTREVFQGRYDSRWFKFVGTADAIVDNNYNDPEGKIATEIIVKAFEDGTFLEIFKDKQPKFSR
jgi:shikimate kinase